jgi:hypothetical protein
MEKEMRSSHSTNDDLPMGRILLGVAGVLIGGFLAWIPTAAMLAVQRPQGIGNWAPPAYPWHVILLMWVSIASGAVVGLALSQFRHMPGDEATGNGGSKDQSAP